MGAANKLTRRGKALPIPSADDLIEKMTWLYLSHGRMPDMPRLFTPACLMHRKFILSADMQGYGMNTRPRLFDKTAGLKQCLRRYYGYHPGKEDLRPYTNPWDPVTYPILNAQGHGYGVSKYNDVPHGKYCLPECWVVIYWDETGKQTILPVDTFFDCF